MSVLLTLTEQLVDLCFAAIPRARPRSHLAKSAVLIAHRGAHDNKQGIFENTHKAFQRAKEFDCWGIEFDVHCTVDKVFVVNHDPDLKRLWQQDVAIAELSFSELRHLAPEVPSLEEVVDEFSDSLHLFIELKVPIVNQQVLLEVLSGCEPIKQYHLLTFDPHLYEELDRIPKSALLLVAAHNNISALCDLSIKKQYAGVLGNYLLFTKKRQSELMQANQFPGVGFVNSKNSLYRELNRGMQLLFTNEAERVSRYLNDLR